MIPASCDVSVIICAYTEERWDDLVAAIASLHIQTKQPDEIILVIDYNTRLFERALAHIPDAIVVENSASHGLSGARNTGLDIARGAFIAFLDDDAEAELHWLDRLIRCCSDLQTLGAGGTVVPRWQGKQPGWFPPEFYWVLGCTYQTIPEHPIVVRNPYGGCTCIKREVFQAVGGFREDVGRIGVDPKGGEETELSIRATQLWPEKVFRYEPHACIYHHIPVTRACWSYFINRCYAEGLSKALISHYVGTKDSLSSEREYVLRTLPQGVIHNLAKTLFHHDPRGLLRAGAILAGLSVTIFGYIVGRLFVQAPKKKPHSEKKTISDQQTVEHIYSPHKSPTDVYACDEESLPG